MRVTVAHAARWARRFRGRRHGSARRVKQRAAAEATRGARPCKQCVATGAPPRILQRRLRHAPCFWDLRTPPLPVPELPSSAVRDSKQVRRRKMETMRAAVFMGKGQIKLQEVPRPEPGPGEA